MKSRLLPGLLLAAVTLVTIGLSEGAVRLVARMDSPLARQLNAWDPYAVKVEPHGSFGYRPRPGVVFPYPGNARATQNEQGFRGPVVQKPKPSGTVRILLLGESTTHGWGVNDDETIDAYLRTDLAGRLQGRSVEVVNLAFDGYDTWQILQRLLSDGVALEPDAIVLNAGVNDVRNARHQNLADPDPRTLIWEGEMRRLRWEREHGGPKPWTRAKHYLYLARLPGVVRSLRAAAQGGPRPAESVFPDAAEIFSRNVGRIADEAAKLGVPLILSTPPSVLTKAGAPRMEARSYWIVNPEVTQAYRDTLAARLTAVARDRSARGQPVGYLAHDLPPGDFLDDCHLTAAGNRRMAADFATALVPLVAETARPAPAAGRTR